MSKLDINNRLQGIVCASITPFTKECNIDEKSLISLMEYLVSTGVDALFPLGTNGEGLFLNVEGRMHAAEIILKTVDGKKPVIIHCGAATLKETLALLYHARQNGASACGVITPFFFPLSQQALFEYYDCLLTEADGFPVYAYNIPSRTGNDLLPLTLQKLREKHHNLVGIKYSASDLTRLCQYMSIPETDTLLGCDRLIYPAMIMGAKGAISGPCALMPDLFCMLRDSIGQGNYAKAIKLQIGLQKISETLKKYQELPMLKVNLASMGIIKSEYCLAPFHTMTEDEKQSMVMDVQGAIEALRKEMVG